MEKIEEPPQYTMEVKTPGLELERLEVALAATIAHTTDESQDLIVLPLNRMQAMALHSWLRKLPYLQRRFEGHARKAWNRKRALRQLTKSYEFLLAQHRNMLHQSHTWQTMYNTLRKQMDDAKAAMVRTDV